MNDVARLNDNGVGSGTKGNEGLALSILAKSLKPGQTIVEVGTLKGNTSRLLCMMAPQCNVYTIDIRDSFDRNDPVPDNLTVYRGTSATFVEEYPDIEVDYLFIDANHNLLCVLMDFVNMVPLLHPGSIVNFHDYSIVGFPVIVACNCLIDGGNLEDVSLINSLLCTKFTGKSEIDFRPLVNGANEIQRIGNMFIPGTQNRRSLSDEHIEKMRQLHTLVGGADVPYFIGKGLRGKVVAQMAQIDRSGLVDSNQVVHKESNCIICSTHFESIKKYLVEEVGLNPLSCIDGQDYFDYCIYLDLLKNNGVFLRNLMNSEIGKSLVDYLSSLANEQLDDLYRNNAFRWMFDLNLPLFLAPSE